MAKLLRLRRGTTAQHGSFTGAEGEVTVDTTKDTLVVHDNATAGGRPMLREDLNNMPNSGVTAGTYGSSSAIPSITVDAKGRVTSATTSAIDSTAITNGTSNVSVAASGDITVTRAGTLKATFGSSTTDIPGTLTVNQLVVDDDGSSSPTVRISGDDAGPWGLIVNNNSVQSDDNHGLRVQQANNGDIEIHIGGNGVYEALNLYSSDGSGPGPTDLIFKADTDRSARLYYQGSSKLATTSGGIDVTGSVTCDGLTCEGTAVVQAGTGTVWIKDSDNTGVNSTNVLVGVDSSNNEKWKFGDDQAGNEWLYLRNYSTSNGIAFAVGGTDRAYITSSGHLTPGANNTYDLGESSNRWRNVYTNDLNLSNEGGANDVDGTWGSWTIQEGEDDLFLLNRRNGKKYKFNLSEVN